MEYRKEPLREPPRIDRRKAALGAKNETPDVTNGGWLLFFEGQLDALTALDIKFQQQYAAFAHNMQWRLSRLQAKKEVGAGQYTLLDNALDKLRDIEQVRQKYRDHMVLTINNMYWEGSGILASIEGEERRSGDKRASTSGTCALPA